MPIARVDVLSSPSTIVRIRATPPSRFAIGGERPVLHADTIHTNTPVRLEAFLDAGDISIEAEGDVPIDVNAQLGGAPAVSFGGHGRTIVLMAGGRGVQVPRP